MAANIPGYYFDPATNRYFKLRPGESAPINKEIKTGDQERKRAEPKVLKTTSIQELLDKRQMDSITQHLHFKKNISFSIIHQNTEIKKKIEQQEELNQNHSDTKEKNYYKINNNTTLSLIPQHYNSSEFLLQYSNYSCKLLFNYYNKKNHKLESKIVGESSPERGAGNINCATWGNWESNTPANQEEFQHLEQYNYMIALSGSGNTNGRCLIYSFHKYFNQLDNDNMIIPTFETKHISSLAAYKKTVFSCCWQPKSTNICLGVTKGCLLFDAQNSKMKGRFSLHSDVLQQQISTEGIIYNGIRGGKIQLIDSKARDSVKSFLLGPLKKNPRFCSNKFYNYVNPTKLMLCGGDNYLLSSYSDGKVNKFIGDHQYF